MKNMIELPTEADYHQTKLIDILQSHNFEKKEDTITYKKCIINLRSIVDISEKTLIVNVLDEEKYPAYLEEVEKMKARPRPRRSFGPSIPAVIDENATVEVEDSFQPDFGPQFEPPVKQIKVVGVLILYFNGSSRFVVDDYQDFEEMYFNYLKKQNLDIR